MQLSMMSTAMRVQVPTGLTQSEMECDASIRLGAVLSNAQQLEHNSQAELRAYLHMSAYLRLATQQRGVSCLPACLPVRPSACLPACLSVHLPACLPVCPSACLPACLSVCLPACLSVCLPA